MIDTNAALRAWLLQSDTLTTYVDDRVFCPDLPKGTDPTNDGESVVIRTRGGNADPYVPIVKPSVQITAWGATAARARAIYGAVFDLIHGAENVDLADLGFVYSCTEQVQGQDITDPDTGWPTVVSFFELTMRAT